MKWLYLKGNLKSLITGTLSYKCSIWEPHVTRQMSSLKFWLLPTFVKSVLINCCDGIGNRFWVSYV